MYSDRGEMHVSLKKAVVGGGDFAERGIPFSFFNCLCSFSWFASEETGAFVLEPQGLNSINTNEQRNQFL